MNKTQSKKIAQFMLTPTTGGLDGAVSVLGFLDISICLVTNVATSTSTSQQTSHPNLHTINTLRSALPWPYLHNRYGGGMSG